MAVVTQTIQDQVTELYLGFFGRAPDAAGFGYWTSQVAAGAVTPTYLASQFAATPEFISNYGGLTPTQQVTKVYLNVLNRTPDAAGLNYWVAALNAGTPIGTVVWQIVNAAFSQVGTADGLLVQNKVAVGEYFAITVAGNDTAAAAAAYLNVTSDTSSIAAAESTLVARTFTLTTEINNFVGASTGFNAFVSNNTAGSLTFNPLDSINGGAGPNNTFTINDVSSTTLGSGLLSTGLPAGSTVANVQTVNINTLANVGRTSATAVIDNFSGWTGLTQLNITEGLNDSNITVAGTTNLTLTSTDTTNTTATTTVNGGKAVTVTAGGVVSIGGTSAPTGAVKVVDTSAGTNAALGAAVTVVGGTTQTVTSAGNVTLSKATGAINVTEGSIITGAGKTGAAISISGGTTVNVSTLGATGTNGVFAALVAPQTAATVTVGGSGTGGAIAIATNATTGQETLVNTAATGNVVVNNSTNLLDAAGGVTRTYYGNAVNSVDVLGATSVTVVGGTVAAVTGQTNGTSSAFGGIVDLGTTLLLPATGGVRVAGTSTLSSVNLAGVSGAVAVNSDALTSLTVSDSQAGGNYGQSAVTAVTVTNNTAGHGLAITLSNTAANTQVTDNVATSFTVTTGAATNDGAAASAIKLTGTLVATETFTNAATLTVVNDTNAALRSIVANNSGILDLGTVANTVTSVNATGATGAVSAALTATATSFAGGAGNDVVTIAADATKSISGGAGVNTLVLNNTGGTFTTPVALNVNVSNFQTLGFGTAASGNYISGAVFTTLETLAGLAGNVAVSNISAGTKLKVDGALLNKFTYALGADTASDTIDMTVGTALNTGTTTFGTVDASLIENINLHLLGTGVAGATNNTLTIVDTAAKALVIDGVQNATLTIAGPTAITSVNTVGNTGKLDLTNVITSTNGATFTTGTGISSLYGQAGLGNTDTIVAGNGAVTFSERGAGAISATLGDGANSISFSAATTADASVTAGNGINTIDFSNTSHTTVITLGNGGTSGTNQVAKGGSSADVIRVGTGFNAVTGNAGADTVTFGTHALTTADTVIIAAAGDTGANSAVAGDTVISTTAFDKYIGLNNASADKINLNAVIGNWTTTNLAVATNLAAVDDKGVFARGNYDSVANTFTYSSTGTSTLLTYDTTVGAGVAGKSIVLVGFVEGGTLTATAAAGVITLA